jgi:hypothetical protein
MYKNVNNYNNKIWESQTNILQQFDEIGYVTLDVMNDNINNNLKSHKINSSLLFNNEKIIKKNNDIDHDNNVYPNSNHSNASVPPFMKNPKLSSQLNLQMNDSNHHILDSNNNHCKIDNDKEILETVITYNYLPTFLVKD